MESTRQRALWVMPFWISFGVTILRFVLEKMGAPEPVNFVVGIFWLAPIFGIYFAIKVDRWGALFKNLALYAISVRVLIVALMVLASYFHWGTHYDISDDTTVTGFGQTFQYESNSLVQHLQLIYFAQLVIGTLIGIVTGMITGSITLLLRRKSAPSAA